MADRSNYADKPINEDCVGALPEHRLALGDHRGFTPSDGEHEDGEYGGLAIGATGDWGWRPGRYPNDPGIVLDEFDVWLYNEFGNYVESPERRAQLEAQMPTYRPKQHPLHGIRPFA